MSVMMSVIGMLGSDEGNFYALDARDGNAGC